MATNEGERDWPPGTVRIELFRSNKEVDIVLQPRPSSDPNDPLNWKRWEKHWNFSLTIVYTFMVFVLIDAATPTWGPMNLELGFSYAILNDSYAAACTALAVGSVCLVPFALKYGRRPIYILTTAGQAAVAVWSARIHTVADLMLVNVFSCFLGSLSEVIIQMTIADMYFVHQRGLMNAWFLFALNSGGLLGPLAAGYITDARGLGWRWVWWIITAFWGALLIALIFTYEDTKYEHGTPNNTGIVSMTSTGIPSYLMEPKSKTEITKSEQQAIEVSSDSEAQEPGQSLHDVNEVQINTEIPRKMYWQRMRFTTTTSGHFSTFLRHTYQPFQIMFTIPAVFYMSVIYGLVCVWQSVMVVTLSTWMLGPPWNFSAASIGLMSLAPFVGCTVGSIITGPLSDWTILWLSKRNGGIYEPEMRLWMMVPFAPLLPIGAFLYGYGLALGWSWPVIAISYAIANGATSPLSSIAVTYITDSYTEIVGDALVGVTFTRNILSTVFVFALFPWINAVGIANVYLTMGIIGIFILLFIGLFIWKGKDMRRWTAKRYRYYASRQFGARTV